LLELVQWTHERSLGTYGAPRVHADLTMERGVSCGRKRVARLMRNAGTRGVCYQRKRRGWKPLPAPHDDLVKRQFSAHAPNRVWFCDVTQHRARDGWVYCVAVIDAYSHVVVGWSIGDHLWSELVVDALKMARWQRKPAPRTIVNSDRGAQYTSWIFGHRLR
jgi:putative transposase